MSLCTRAAMAAGVAAFLSIPPSPALLAQETGRIEGVVLLGENHPATTAEVRLAELGLLTTVDTVGRFSFLAVPGGTYLIEARVPGGARVVERVSVMPGAAASVTLNLMTFFHLEEIVVSAGPLSMTREEAYQATGVVTGRDLVATGEASLGETLSRQPGITSSYAGPGTSRPLIRGLGGDRVRILEAGIGTGDVSSSSPDHAVGVEPRSADRIEILRGPATLLYGSAAIGGVVNVLTDNIARTRPTKSLSGYAEGLAGRVSGEETVSAALNARVGPLVAHASGLRRETGDVTIPGFAHDVGGAHPQGAEEPAGVLEGSAVSTRRAGGAATLVGEPGYLGVAFTDMRSTYGVPNHLGAAGPVAIDLDQERLDLEGALRRPGRLLQEVKLRLGRTDYGHRELEGGDVSTRVLADSWEGRLEVLHRGGETTSGAAGIHVTSRELEILGEEVFVPPSSTSQAALFVFENWTLSEDVRVQGGLRYEWQASESPTQGIRRTDGGLSASGGLNWMTSEGITLAASLSRSSKLPNTEELFSNGPHAATLAFEVGDADLRSESAWNMDMSLHAHSESFRGTLSVFRAWFGDYIYQRVTAEEVDDLALVRYEQDDADFMGFEVEVEADLLHHDAGSDQHHLTIDLFSDYVRAGFSSTGEALPRIPPMRAGTGLSYGTGLFAARAGITWVTDQGRIAPTETPTEGYVLADATLSYRFFAGGIFHDLTFATSNLTNAEARVHSSFLKDVTPLPGRELRLVYRISF